MTGCGAVYRGLDRVRLDAQHGRAALYQCLRCPARAAADVNQGQAIHPQQRVDDLCIIEVTKFFTHVFLFKNCGVANADPTFHLHAEDPFGHDVALDLVRAAVDRCCPEVQIFRYR